MYDEPENWIGKTFAGKWRIERLLGTGGMGSVLLGRGADGAAIAIKVLHPELNANVEIRKRFLREGHIGTALSSEQIPGIVRILGSSESPEGIAYLTMELLQGESLFDRMDRVGIMPQNEVLALAEQVLDSLVAAHAKGIIHRDLKPENIHLGSDGRVRMLDFGIARVLDGIQGLPEQTRTKTGMIMGTATYMAPEQATGLVQEIDGRTDIFGLGATMFRLLSGRPIHGDVSDALEVIAAATEEAPPLASVAPSVSPNVCAIVDRALAHLKPYRYPNAEIMRADVQAVRAGHPPPYARAVIDGRIRAGELPAQGMYTAPQVTAQGMAPQAPAPGMAAAVHPQPRIAPAPVAQPARQPVRPAPTVIDPSLTATTASDRSRPTTTVSDARPMTLGQLALLVGGLSLAIGVIVGIVLVGC